MSLTKGRWEYAASMGDVISVADDGSSFRVATVEANDADGYAMAAAKEMLAALKAARGYVAGCGNAKDVAMVDAAIAKAEGR